MTPMKVAQIPKAGADFEIVEREIPNPSAGEVRIKVQACGICHSDVSDRARGPDVNVEAILGALSQTVQPGSPSPMHIITVRSSPLFV